MDGARSGTPNGSGRVEQHMAATGTAVVHFMLDAFSSGPKGKVGCQLGHRNVVKGDGHLAAE